MWSPVRLGQFMLYIYQSLIKVRLGWIMLSQVTLHILQLFCSATIFENAASF